MKRSSNHWFWTLLSLAALGCAVDGEQGPQGDPGETEYPRLYVVGAGTDNVCVFDNAGTAGWSYGDIYPDREIACTASGNPFDWPTGLWLERNEASSTLYVVNNASDEILVFDNADGIDGDTVPSRVVASDAFSLPTYAAVEGEALYVSGSPYALLIFDGASSLGSDGAKAEPNRKIAGPSTGLNYPQELEFDTENDILYVANEVGDNVLIFEDYATIGEGTNNDVAYSRQLNTGLDGPTGMFLDASVQGKRLYVANYASDAIAIWDNVAAAGAGTAPTRTLVGASTQLDAPYGVEVDLARDRLYVACGDMILIWNDISATILSQTGGVSVDIAPDRVITGNTQFSGARSIVLETGPYGD